MMLKCTVCALLLVALRSLLIDCRSYNTGLIFYNLENHNTYLPPTISVSRGRGLAKFKYSPRGSIWSTFGKPCDCKGPFCGCCVGIKVKQYNFDQKMCANVSYARPRDEVQLEVFLNDTATAKYGVSARNPSPLCVPIMMGIPMSMCIQMSNIGVQGDNLNMCMDFLVRLASTELFEMHFQCMKIGLQGASWVGQDGQPVIPANEGKLKDKISVNSDEYYDENEAENEIIPKEEDEQSGMKGMKEDDDLNKAEEEMDNNDITEKIMDIVKETEQQNLNDNSEISKENKVESMFRPFQENKNVQEIVTNIMDSINHANKLEETAEVKELLVPSKLEPNKSTTENIKETQVGNNTEDRYNEKQIEHFIQDSFNKIETKEEDKKEIFKDSHELQENVPQSEINSSKQDISDGNTNYAENKVVKNSADLLENKLKDEFNVADLFEDSEEKEMQMESDQMKSKGTIKAPVNGQPKPETVMTPIIVLEESTTEKILEQQMISEIEHSDTLDSINGSEYDKFLEITPPIIEATTQSMIIENDALVTTQKTLFTTGTAAIMTATTKTSSTTTNEPTKLNANFIVAATFANNTEIADDAHTEGEEEDDADSGDDDDDNSHENDSDYEDEESEETDHKTKEKTIEFNNTTTTVKSNALNENNLNGNDPKESPALQEDVNNSNSDESQSAEDDNENTNDEFETEEGEEYDEEYEDYETAATAEVTAADKEVNNTCCKPVITILPTIKPFKHINIKSQISHLETATSQNLQFVSTSNGMTSKTGDKNMLNIKSANKISQANVDSTATANTIAGGNAMPLPLARKLHFSLLHQHYQRPQQQQPHQLEHQNRQLQQLYV